MNPSLPRPSLVQRVCWLFAGAEMHLLRQCPADFNRQASIGFTIFMTCLFAALSGGYAAWRFTAEGTGDGSWAAAVVFGLVWGVLIFSIDRSMVVTLKKDPTKAKQDFWGAFLARAVLAALLAFLISIPIEIRFFKERIDIQMGTDIANEVKQADAESDDEVGIKKLEKQRDITKAALAGARANNNLPEPPTGAYTTAKSQRDAIAGKIPPIQVPLNKLVPQIPFLRDAIPSDPIKDPNTGETIGYSKRQYGAARAKFNAAVGQKNSLQAKLNAINTALDIANNNLITIKSAYYANTATLVTKAENDAAKKIASLDSAITDAKRILAGRKPALEKKGFVREFEALGHAVDKDGTVRFLLWLIRLIFFTIELLPTIVKLVTPVGEYDWLLYNHEQEFALRLRTNLRILQDQERQREAAEATIATDYQASRQQVAKGLNESVLRATADRQNKLALHKLDEWYQQQSATAPTSNSNGQHTAAAGTNHTI